MSVGGVALGAILYCLWQWHFRQTLAYAQAIYPISDADEWRYTACSRLVEHGYPLFTSVFSAQPPLLYAALAGGMAMVADNIAGARSVEVVFGAVALASSCWLAAELAGSGAAAITAILLAVSLGFLVYARAVEAEGPMLALATLSLALAARYRRVPSTGIAMLSGLALAGAVLMKLFAVEVLVPALWIVVTAGGSRRRRATHAVSMVLAVILPVIADFALLAPAEQWRQVVTMHEAAARLNLAGVDPTWQTVGAFLKLDAGLSLLALCGFLALVVRGRKNDAILFALWIGGSALMLLTFQPLFPHHPVILITGLACCAGVGTSAGMAALAASPVARFLMLAGALVYVALLPRLVHADLHVLYPQQGNPTRPYTQYISARTGVHDLVAVDDLRVADETHRLVVPPLCDPSNVRLRSGYLTTADAISATRHYQPRVVLFSFGIFQQIPGYEPWLARTYVRHVLAGGAKAYGPQLVRHP
ncbi:MAG: hypothetical protein NVS4B2_25610 [Chloroflexota bacterium]